MTVYIALLRGINVGGVRLSMADLRRIANGCGFTEPKTYIQSGNLVFTSSRRNTDALADDLRTAIRADVSLDVPIMIRTAAELRAVVEHNPFLAEGQNEAMQSVSFFAERVDPALFADVDLDRFAPEALRIVGREVYLHLPVGTGHSPMLKEIGRRKGLAIGTARNWRTVTTLLAMARDS